MSHAVIKSARRWLATPPGVASALVVVATLLHLAVAGRFGLSVDEAHYALYGYRPDWSYFDHPPMVGWLQAIALSLGDSEFFLRLWPIALAALASGILYRLTRELFPEQPGWVAVGAVIFLQSAIMFQLISLALVPDGPLLVFGLSAGLFLFRALERERMSDWLAVGICFGLAGLSKYTAITLVLTALLGLWWLRRWKVLRTPGPWIAVIVAAILILPVIWWNWQHDWISFRYQIGHGAPDRTWEAGRFLTSEARQLGAYGPGVFLFGLVGLATMASVSQREQPGVRFSLALALPVLVLFAWSGGFEEILPHWTLLGWAALAPLAAKWVLERWERRSVRWSAIGALALSGCLILAIHAQLFIPWIPFTKHRHPFGDLIGWRQAAHTAERLRLKLAASEGEGGRSSIFVGNWSLASRIAWYDRPQPVMVTDNRFDQFDLWFGAPKKGSSGILIVPDNYHGHPEKSGVAHFETCTLVQTLPVSQDSVPVHTFRFYQCQGYQG